MRFNLTQCGWYWGPVGGEMAEKLLETEPCGSFIVRDSSDEHYIFSLTFKLNGIVRHVRIEHDQGTVAAYVCCYLESLNFLTLVRLFDNNNNNDFRQL